VGVAAVALELAARGRDLFEAAGRVPADDPLAVGRVAAAAEATAGVAAPDDGAGRAVGPLERARALAPNEEVIDTNLARARRESDRAR